VFFDLQPHIKITCTVKLHICFGS